MARIRYKKLNMGADRLAVVDQAEGICQEYAARGLSITLRQCYYQFVARGLMANTDSNYTRLGDILNDARMAGLFDWDYLIDRTRNLVRVNTWSSPRLLVEAAAEQYRADLWKPQKQRVEVWIEKDAGIGVIEGVCNHNGVPYFSCRGYTSASEMWAAGQRIGDHLRRGERVTILHIGDHDPSGLDMTRFMQERLALFVVNDWKREFLPGRGYTSADVYEHMRLGMRQMGSTITDIQAPFRLKRIALNMDQVEQYNPPPNPAKMSDSRIGSYLEATGGLRESWELDALDPAVLADLIQAEIDVVRDTQLWDAAEIKQEEDRAVLHAISANWSRVADTYRSDRG